MSSPLKIAVILGSTRQGRFSEQPGVWIKKKASALPSVNVRLIDLRDYPMPFFNESESPADAKKPYDNLAVKKFAKQIAWAEAFIIITPEYNHGYPAVLKNALDYLYKEWNYKPVGFVAYGGAAGARSVEQLKPVVIQLKMIPIAPAVHIRNYWGLLDEKGVLKTETLEKAGDGFLKELIRWAKLCRKMRK